MFRLILIILLFLISLLSLFKAPAYYFWLLAILVTEFPLIFVGLTALITGMGFWFNKYRFAGTILGVITIFIFLTPIIRAYWVAKNMKQDMGQALNANPNNTAPFSFLKLFKITNAVPFRTITYVKYHDTALSLDFYPSQVAGKKPCVIMVHGGSWSSGDSRQLPELNSELAKKGYNVAAINYRMAPKYQSPAPVQDIEAAIRYLRKHANELHIDTNQLVLLGRSAGSQIALLAAYTLHEPGLRGVIDFYGPADMVWGYSVPSNPLIMDSRKVMENYIGGTYKQVPQQYAACSPIEFVSAESVPTLIIHGGNDVLVAYEHSRRLNKMLDENRVKHYWLKLPWATHGFDYNLNGPGGQLSTYAVETFLKTVCPPTP